MEGTAITETGEIETQTQPQVPEQIPADTSDSAVSCTDTCTAGIQNEIEQKLQPETSADQATEVPQDFEPKIIAFCCNWCSYAGADLAGVSRLQYPPNVRIIRVLCSGRVEPDFILRALELGADGVLVAGCHPGDCHYISGNLKAEKRFQMLSKLLEVLGINKHRARLEWISASEGPKFANTITEFVDQIKELGPSKFKIKK